MSIFLAVLAVIGKILLIILLAVLVLVLYLLFTPFMYKADGAFDREEGTVFVAKLHDFSHFFGISVAYSDGLAARLTLLWGAVKIPLGKKDKTEMPKKEKQKRAEEEESGSEKEDVKTSDSEKTGSEKPKDKKKKEKKPKSIAAAVAGNIGGLNYIIGKVFALIGKMKPTVLTADLDYSAGEPDTTGYVTGVLAMLPFVYGKKKSFRPDFQSDDPYVSGTLGLKGKIFLFQAVYIIIKIIANKESRDFIGDVLGAVKQQKKDKAALDAA